MALDEVHFLCVVPSVRRRDFTSPNILENSAGFFEEVELSRRERPRCAHKRRDGSKSHKSRGIISPTHKRTEGRALVWGSEFTSKDAALQGGS